MTVLYVPTVTDTSTVRGTIFWIATCKTVKPRYKTVNARYKTVKVIHKTVKARYKTVKARIVS